MLLLLQECLLHHQPLWLHCAAAPSAPAAAPSAAAQAPADPAGRQHAGAQLLEPQVGERVLPTCGEALVIALCPALLLLLLFRAALRLVLSQSPLA